jgi:outer membrane protein TolC
VIQLKNSARRALLGMLVLTVNTTLISGCTSIPANRGLADIGAQLAARGNLALPPLDDSRNIQLVDELLAHTPLTLDDAVRVALLANPQLRTRYAQLGLSAADVYNAGRLGNPTLSASILFGGDGNKTAFGLAQNFTDLLLLPARSRLAKGEFERTKATIGAALIDFSAAVEAAYHRVVGAEQVARMRETIATAADTSAALAQRFFDAGNISRLELELNQVDAQQTQLDLLAAKNAVAAARAELNQQLGLSADHNRWSVVEQLPPPVAAEDQLTTLQTLAENSRLDLDAARREVALLEDNYGVARRTRLQGDSQIGVDTERETAGARLTGPTLALQLPLFQQGQGNVLRASAQLELSRAALDELRIAISNAVQLAHVRVVNTRAMALRYQQQLLPLRERIVKQTQQQANYMLIGQFELIRAKQQEYNSYQQALESVRDYWLARVELARAVGSRLPSAAQIQPAAPPADAGNSAAPVDHSQHE